METDPSRQIDLRYPEQDYEELWPGQDIAMTLIAVVKETEESLLIAADNLERGGGGFSVTPRSKLHKSKGGVFAWACSGNAAVGSWLSNHLSDNVPMSWETVSNPAALPKVVAQLNADQRGIIQLTRNEWKDDYGVTCVMAGCLDGGLGIWDIDTNGQPTPHMERGVLFDGGPAQYAEVAWAVLEDSTKAAIDKLRAVYRCVALNGRIIDENPDVWRITSEGITVVQGRDDDSILLK